MLRNLRAFAGSAVGAIFILLLALPLWQTLARDRRAQAPREALL